MSEPGAIRRAAVAGTFYPADPVELRATVETLLGHAVTLPLKPKAVIAPHAGFAYSGPVAAAAYAQLAARRGEITRVVLLGPSHRVPVNGLAASSAEAFETPLGRMPLDRDAIEAASMLPQVDVVDAAHRQEHSLEVQLPFLQVVLQRFQLVPFTLGEAAPAETAELLELLWGGEETLIVISSDLSHFHADADAKRIDAETCRMIEDQQWQRLTGPRACGFRGIAGLLQLARARDLPVTTLDLRNSSDTAGGQERVVGYGAWVVG